ncbi:MAG: winged helix-turn-helix transcriptional regulator [Planctomycetota bacterium]
MLVILSGRWKARVIYQLLGGECRYSELERRIGEVSQRQLSQVLNELQADGVIQRVEKRWSLTPSGRDLAAPLRALYAWGEEHIPLQ